MPMYGKREALFRLIVASAILHFQTIKQKILQIDAQALDVFLQEWFRPNVASNLVNDLKEFIPIEVPEANKARLISVFSEIEIDEVKAEKRVILPEPINRVNYSTDLDSSTYFQAMQNHVASMKEKAKKMVWTSVTGFYESYHALFKNYTANLPAMFENSETTIALYEKHKIDSIFQYGHDEMHMIDFDLSGMQSFIYEVTEGGDAKRQIAKTVRGRSFYLSLLSDFVGYALLNVFDLPYEFFVVSAGGKGTVAIPKTEGSSQLIKSTLNRIEEMIFHAHRTRLSIAFTSRTVTKDVLLKDGNYHAVDIDQKLSSSKKNKFKYVLENLDQSTIVQSQEKCILCGSPAESGHEHCHVCASAINLSNALARNKQLTIVYDFGHNEVNYDDMSIAFGEIGCVHIIHNEDVVPTENSYYVSLNHESIGDIKYYANVFAEGASFQEIAETDHGDEKLAVLKMDVDNLGLLFLTGLKIENHSYYKYLTLSRRVDYFFTKDLATICRQRKYHQKVYVSYAGGDDLVLVCPAHRSLHLLNDIMKAFGRYSCGHRKIHLSAGIGIFHPKSPFRYAVKFADDGLEKAKDMDGKNSFSILHNALPNQLIDEVIEEIEHYEQAYKDGIISKSIIRRLYLALNESLILPSPETTFYANIPHISYMLERNIESRYEEEKVRLKHLFVTKSIDIKKLVKYHVVFGIVLMITRNLEREEGHK